MAVVLKKPRRVVQQQIQKKVNKKKKKDKKRHLRLVPDVVETKNKKHKQRQGW